MNICNTIVDKEQLFACYQKTYSLRKLENSVDQSSIYRATKRGKIKFNTLKRYCQEFHFKLEDLILDKENNEEYQKYLSTIG